MKRLILSLAAVAFLAAPAMAQADGLYVSPEKQAILNAHSDDVSLSYETVDAAPDTDKYCPGPKKAKVVRTRLRNWKGATLWNRAMKVSACRNANGSGWAWKRISWTISQAPSHYWVNVGSPFNEWKNGTAWSEQILREKENWGYMGDDTYWHVKLYINPHWNSGIWFSKGSKVI